MPAERRARARVKCYRPVRLYKNVTSPQVLETLTKDLGVEGLRCLSATVVPVTTELQVELTYAPGEAPFVARGRAIWFRALPQSEQFEIGVSFLDSSPHDKRRLSAYLDLLSQPLVQPAITH